MVSFDYEIRERCCFSSVVSNGWLVGVGTRTGSGRKDRVILFPFDGSTPIEWDGMILIGDSNRIELWARCPIGSRASQNRLVYSQGKFVEYSEDIPFEEANEFAGRCGHFTVSKQSHYESLEEEALAILLNTQHQNMILIHEGRMEVIDPMPNDTIQYVRVAHDNKTILIVGMKTVLILDNLLVHKA